MDYPHLFSPGRIGTLTLPNRVVMTAASACLSQPDGSMTEEMLAYYEARARGGVGLIITEMVCVDEQRGVLFPRELNAAREENIAAFRSLADRIHPYGTKLFAQLFHPGANADPSLNPQDLISASDGLGKWHHGTRTPVRAMTQTEIHALTQAFGQAALRVQAGGFDGVEIHAAHHYLLHSFLSPATNHRTDAYGGTLLNRARILREIIEAIRAQCGADFPIQFRISVEEYIGPAGYHADTGVKVCQLLEQWGADAINVTAGGTASKLSQSMEPMCYPQGWRKHLAKAVKGAVSIPVVAVSILREPAYADRLIAQGVLDFAGSVRAHLADPDWTNKARSGQERDILPCVSCMACLGHFATEGHISCAVNPTTGYEAVLPPLSCDGNDRLVVVLGGGPGGLEAAWVARQRGFRVILFERAKSPGGQLRLAIQTPEKERLAALLDSLLSRCAAAGVEFRMECTPTVEALRDLSPVAILDATGGVPKLPTHIPGLDSPLVCTPPALLSGDIHPTEESIVVVGSGMTGLECAQLLSQRGTGNAVLVLEAEPRLAPGALGSNRNVVTAMLEVQQVVCLTNRTLTKIGTDRVWFIDSQTGEEFVYPCDRVVLALGVQPADPYQGALASLGIPVYNLGDRVRAGQLWEAIHDGYRAALSL